MTTHITDLTDDFNTSKEEFWYPIFAFTLATAMVIMSLQISLELAINYTHDEFSDYINNSIEYFNELHTEELFPFWWICFAVLV